MPGGVTSMQYSMPGVTPGGVTSMQYSMEREEIGDSLHFYESGFISKLLYSNNESINFLQKNFFLFTIHVHCCT
jgi:hypothetical protein